MIGFKGKLCTVGHFKDFTGKKDNVVRGPGSTLTLTYMGDVCRQETADLCTAAAFFGGDFLYSNVT